MPKAKRKTSQRNSRPTSKPIRHSNALVRVDSLSLAEKVEQVLIGGDLSPLTPEERVDYYKKVSMSIGVNQLTRPFEYILFREPGGNPKLQLYANKSCTEQLRKIHSVSVIDHQQTIEGDYVHVQVKVQDRTGRTDFSLGSVPLFKYKDGTRFDLSGVERCNAIMKASTKAKRRATLSICGLAFLDESELDGVRVVGGVTPEGRIYHLPDQQDDEPRQLTEGLAHGHEPGSEKAKQAEAALARVEEEDRKLKEQRAAQKQTPKEDSSKHTEEKAKGIIELDLTDPNDPIIRGDIGDLLELIQKHCTAKWSGDWWHILPADVATIHAMGQQFGFRVMEILPKQVPTKEAGAAQNKAASPAAQSQAAPVNSRKETRNQTSKAAAAGSSQPGEPLLVKGTIERVFVTIKGNKSFAMVTLATTNGKREAGCWDKDIYEYLDKGKGKMAEVFFQTKGQYTNLVSLKRIGAVEFEHGKVPAVKKDREPGAAGNLFQP